jgi:hypothetical protein
MEQSVPSQWPAFFSQWEGCQRRRQQPGKVVVEADVVDFIKGYEAECLRFQQEDEHRATEFNVLRLLKVLDDENRHSNVLAWMLDHDFIRATHSQGAVGFAIFCEKMGLPDSYAQEPDYQVRREVKHERSRIDIEIACTGKFIIHIEVKVGAGLGTRQLEREWEDLTDKAVRLGCPAAVHAFYLT